MNRRYHITVLLVSVFLPLVAANAQPMLVTEHDWTFAGGNGRWGIFQTNIAPGYMQRRTTVCLGSPFFTVTVRAEVLLTLVVVPLGAFGFMLLRMGTGKRD
jgi:hypothetical protein